ncbi:AAA family ATPase [Sorangium sp. So ce861]|uniref:AAA family ATPase n=1 Tax=Sorangium sp. So ce861 TaxID=3133323 RepID=UPI003F6176FC
MTARGSLLEAPSIVLITGLMAAGKSTVAQRLAERLPRSVHLRGDVFRRMIVGGRAELGFELSEEAERQLRLRYRIAAAAADLYVEAGFTVVHQDIILGAGLTEVVRCYAHRSLHVVVLCPRPDVVAAREAGRAKRGYQDTSAVLDFDRVLREETPRLGLWLDTSDLTVEETVDEILGRFGDARVDGAGSS